MRCFEVHLQRPQVSVVDADERRARVQGPVAFLEVVDLNERRKSERLSAVGQPSQVGIVEGCDDQQDGVSTSGARLEELILVDHEVLAQQGNLHDVPDRNQVLE